MPTTLTAEELEVAERRATSLERFAARWPTLRFYIVAMTLANILAGWWLTRGFLWATNLGFDVVKGLEGVEAPNDMPPQLWYVLEVRRVAQLLQNENQIRNLEAVEGVVGILLFSGGAILAAMLAMNWNRGAVRGVEAKLLRMQIEQARQTDPGLR